MTNTHDKLIAALQDSIHAPQNDRVLEEVNNPLASASWWQEIPLPLQDMWGELSLEAKLAVVLYAAIRLQFCHQDDDL
jgi:hypothetical protein